MMFNNSITFDSNNRVSRCSVFTLSLNDPASSHGRNLKVHTIILHVMERFLSDIDSVKEMNTGEILFGNVSYLIGYNH